MLTKTLMSAVLILGVSSFAIAQTTPATPTAPATGAATSGKMTEAQIKQKLTEQGYSDIDLKPVAARGVAGSGSSTAGSGSTSPSASPGAAATAGNDLWAGTAMKAGKKVNVEVDATGKVTER